ncbi:protein of unknown function (plasmid) [Pararobbsia alpina]
MADLRRSGRKTCPFSSENDTPPDSTTPLANVSVIVPIVMGWNGRAVEEESRDLQARGEPQIAEEGLIAGVRHQLRERHEVVFAAGVVIAPATSAVKDCDARPIGGFTDMHVQRIGMESDVAILAAVPVLANREFRFT